MTEHKRFAAVSEVAAEGDADAHPMGMVERLPEVSVPIGSLVPGFHLRASGVDASHVRLLADAAGSVRLPAILVQKCGARIIDGMHRFEVAKLRGEWSIKARIVDCTDSEALILAVKSNTLHGLPLSRVDRIAGAKRILAEHADWSDRAVAEITGLSAKAIASLRNSATGVQLHFKRLGRDGKRRPVVPGEGRRRAAEYLAAHPEASVRQVARATDVSVGTAQKVREAMRRGALHVPAVPERLASVAETAEDVTAEKGAACPIPQVREPHSGGRAACLRYLAWSVVAHKLASDPALRYTEGGRAFLRWMATHSMQADEWREFADAIPARWLDDVRRLALGMSEEWRQFAEWIKSRQEVISLGLAGEQRHDLRQVPVQPAVVNAISGHRAGRHDESGVPGRAARDEQTAVAGEHQGRRRGSALAADISQRPVQRPPGQGHAVDHDNVLAGQAEIGRRAHPDHSRC